MFSIKSYSSVRWSLYSFQSKMGGTAKLKSTPVVPDFVNPHCKTNWQHSQRQNRTQGRKATEVWESIAHSWNEPFFQKTLKL